MQMKVIVLVAALTFRVSGGTLAGILCWWEASLCHWGEGGLTCSVCSGLRTLLLCPDHCSPVPSSYDHSGILKPPSKMKTITRPLALHLSLCLLSALHVSWHGILFSRLNSKLPFLNNLSWYQFKLVSHSCSTSSLFKNFWLHVSIFSSPFHSHIALFLTVLLNRILRTKSHLSFILIYFSCQTLASKQ